MYFWWKDHKFFLHAMFLLKRRISAKHLPNKKLRSQVFPFFGHKVWINFSVLSLSLNRFVPPIFNVTTHLSCICGCSSPDRQLLQSFPWRVWTQTHCPVVLSHTDPITVPLGSQIHGMQPWDKPSEKEQNSIRAPAFNVITAYATAQKFSNEIVLASKNHIRL